MKIYIAASNQEAAILTSLRLIEAGHDITSSWLSEPFDRTVKYSEAERRAIAETDFDDIADADALVCLESDGLIPGGKFVEVGIALGLEKLVCVVGRRENMLMWHPGISQVDSIEEFIEIVAVSHP